MGKTVSDMDDEAADFELHFQQMTRPYSSCTLAWRYPGRIVISA